MTLEELQVVIDAQTSQFRKEIDKVQKQMQGATNNINNQVNKIKSSFSSLGKFIGGIAIGKFFADSTKQAMQVEGAIQQIKRTMGESSNAFLKWSKNNALAFNMAQSDAIKFGAVYSNLLSSFMGGTKNTTKYTEDLLKASSIIASGTGRSMEDVMERIRSGLLGNTEAIEDLGINVNVAMLESTDAFKRFAGGKSWNQLDFQTQQQIRLFSILEQTSSKFGTEVMNNTNSSLQQLVAVLKDIALNIGNAFLPILNIVIPILTNFAMAIRTATAYVATFMQILFGGKKGTPGDSIKKAGDYAVNAASATGSYNSALEDTGKTAKKTAKEVNRLLGGFDEINSLSNSGSDGGGLPGGGGCASIPDMGGIGLSDTEIYTSGVSEFAEKVKGVFADVSKYIKEHKEIIIGVISGLVAGIASFFVIGKWGAITAAITSLIGYIELIPTAIGVAFLSISWPAVAVAAAIAAIVGAIVYLWQTSEEFRSSVTTIVSGIWDVLSRLWNEILVPIFAFLADVIFTVLKPLAILIGNILVVAVKAVFDILASLWTNILGPIVNFIIDIFVMAIKAIIEIWEAWKPAIQLIGDALLWIWTNIFEPIVDFVVGVFIAVFKQWGDTIKLVITFVTNLFKGLLDFIVGVFTGDWSRAWQGVQSIFSNIFYGLGGIVKGAMNIVIQGINWAIGKINNALTIDVPDWSILPDDIQGKSFGFSIPQIPYLAKGGIVNSATLAMVGEQGKEAVMPLENNTGWITQLANKVSERLPVGNTTSDRPINLTLQFTVGTLKFAKTICTSLNELGKQNGGVIPINL